MDPISEFVDQLMAEGKLTDLPADFKKSLRDQLLVQAYKRVGSVIIAELGDDKAVEFTALLEQGGSEQSSAVNNFLAKHTNKLESKLRTVLADMAQAFLTDLK